MRVDKNKILKLGQVSYFIMDYIFYRGEHYLLAAEIIDNDEVGDEPHIFQEVRQDQKLFFKRVSSEEVLNYICPIFEHNLKNNLLWL